MVVEAHRAEQRRVGAMIRDKYRIDAFIASGSMANVYAATHRNGSRVALKILHKDLARDQKFGERFRREGYFGNAIVHPGIVRAIDDDVTDDGCAFLVFELLEGETLEQKRERVGGKLPLQEALSIADTVLDILAAAHDHQILHRDLKPDNVYLTRKGEVRLLDFGAARFNDGKSTSEMTGTGIILGTPAFMAPEQALGKREEVDARSDLWAVGAMLFVCLTGQGVHAGGDPKTKLISVARTPARSLKDVAPEIPRVVASVIDRALAFDKAERWADAKSMRESLGWARRSLTGSDPGAEPETRRQPATDEEEPTTIGRAQSGPASARPGSSPFDDETEKRTQIAPKVFAGLLGKEPQIKRFPMSEGVITSAPPVTQRETPPSMAPSEGPAFSLRIPKKNSTEDELTLAPAPSSSMRDTPSRMQAAPLTERLPTGSAPRVADPLQQPPTPDAAAIFRAALAEQGLGTNEESAPHTAASPRMSSAAPAYQPIVSGESPIVPFAPAPAPAYHPPTFASVPPLARSAPPHGMVADPIANVGFRPMEGSGFIPPEGALSRPPPGPLVHEVTARRSSPFRYLIPLLVGIVAAGATYKIILRQRAAKPVPVTPVATASAAPIVDAGAPDAALALAPIASTSASAVPAVASSAPPRRRKPKPKPPPSTTGTTAPAADPPPAATENPALLE